MKVIIEIKGGMVAGVYRQGRGPCNGAIVADLDAASVGERSCDTLPLQPLAAADPKTQEIVEALP